MRYNSNPMSFRDALIMNSTAKNLPFSPNLPTNALAILPFLGDNLAHSRLHRCQITDYIIDKQLPMKLIYHYERLSEALKAEIPLQGQLLANFDKLMSQAQFAQLIGISADKLTQPWQLKFNGKLVLFFEQPEIALRLHFSNTLKPFEIVSSKNLEAAVAASFENWQWVDTVEIVSKDPHLSVFAHHPLLSEQWQLQGSNGFVYMPLALAHSIQQFLRDNDVVQTHWLPAMVQAAQTQAKHWLELREL